MAQEFVGTSRALSPDGLGAVTQSLSVPAASIWALLTVETSGRGFLPDRRPPILFERHIFHRLTDGRFDDGDISDPVPGGYGPDGAPQYSRLARAMALDRHAALQSASWGLGQVMGENAGQAGFPDVETMVAAMCDSEDAQLSAVAAFLRSNHLDAPLRAFDWRAFARGYNGPGYAKNQYDTRLAAAYQKFSAGPQPDLTVRTAQLYLTYCGFDPGPVDGTMGNRTRLALIAFQTRQGLPATGKLDDAVAAALLATACPA